MASFSSSLSSSPNVKATDPPRDRYTLGPADSKTEEYWKEEKRRQTLIKHLLRAGLMLETFAWTIFLIPQNNQALLFLIFSRLRNLPSCQWGWGWQSRGGGEIQTTGYKTGYWRRAWQSTPVLLPGESP